MGPLVWGCKGAGGPCCRGSDWPIPKITPCSSAQSVLPRCSHIMARGGLELLVSGHVGLALTWSQSRNAVLPIIAVP